MSVWLFLWLMVFLKIPIVGLFMIVKWAVGPNPEGEVDQDGGIGHLPGPSGPRHPRTRLPRPPRRGPHRAPAPLAPARVRAVVAMQRTPRP